MSTSLTLTLLRRTRFLALFVVAALLPRLLDLPSSAEKPARIAAILALFAQGVVWSNAVVAHWVRRYLTTYGSDGSSVTTINALGILARLAFWVLLLLLALDNAGIQIKALVTGLGIGGLAVALAVQNILGDLFGALAIVLDKPFVIGDSISVDDYRGRVEHIGLKTTRVRSESGEQIIFSNGELLKSRIRNHTR